MVQNKDAFGRTGSHSGRISAMKKQFKTCGTKVGFGYKTDRSSQYVCPVRNDIRWHSGNDLV